MSVHVRAPYELIPDAQLTEVVDLCKENGVGKIDSIGSILQLVDLSAAEVVEEARRQVRTQGMGVNVAREIDFDRWAGFAIDLSSASGRPVDLVFNRLELKVVADQKIDDLFEQLKDLIPVRDNGNHFLVSVIPSHYQDDLFGSNLLAIAKRSGLPVHFNKGEDLYLVKPEESFAEMKKLFDRYIDFD